VTEQAQAAVLEAVVVQVLEKDKAAA